MERGNRREASCRLGLMSCLHRSKKRSRTWVKLASAVRNSYLLKSKSSKASFRSERIPLVTINARLLIFKRP